MDAAPASMRARCNFRENFALRSDKLPQRHDFFGALLGRHALFSVGLSSANKGGNDHGGCFYRPDGTTEYYTTPNDPNLLSVYVWSAADQAWLYKGLVRSEDLP